MFLHYTKTLKRAKGHFPWHTASAPPDNKSLGTTLPLPIAAYLAALLLVSLHKAKASNLFLRLLPFHVNTPKIRLRKGRKRKRLFSLRGIPSTKEKMMKPHAGFSVAADMVDFVKDKVAFASK